MGKATTSAVDFLAAISGELEVYETDGVAVELRSLTFTEVQKLGVKHKDDSSEMAFQALALGLVSPKLDAAQLEQARAGKPGPLMKIAKRVMVISGMAEDEENPGVPTDGDGLSPVPKGTAPN
jgi:hypothetical protein